MLTLAAELSAVAPSTPRMARFNIPDFTYGKMQYSDRPNSDQIEVLLVLKKQAAS